MSQLYPDLEAPAQLPLQRRVDYTYADRVGRFLQYLAE